MRFQLIKRLSRSSQPRDPKIRFNERTGTSEFAFVYNGVTFYVTQNVHYKISAGYRFYNSFKFQPFQIRVHRNAHTPSVDFVLEYIDWNPTFVGSIADLYSLLGKTDYESAIDESEFARTLGEFVVKNLERYREFANTARRRRRRKMGY